MFSFLCKTLIRSRYGYTLAAQNSSMVLSSSSLRYLSIDAHQYSFTHDYLINTCGLSPQSSLQASKMLKFKTPDKPDLIISFFEKFGFLKAQIYAMIRKEPRLLSHNLEKYIFPKVEFFRSKGASTSDLVRILTLFPSILLRSLENHLVPSFNFFRELLQSEGKAIAVVKRFPWIIRNSLECYVIPNINTLRENGVPEANILLLVQGHPRTILINSDKYRKTVKELREMGFNPLNTLFVRALIVLTGSSKSTRDRKVDAYKRWGWSDEDIITAFRKYPWCMATSEDKIMAVMDFYVNKLGLDSSVIAKRPLLIQLSLKKRLIPRAAVIQFLSSKGLVKLDSSITKLFHCTEKCFLENIENYRDEAPHLLNLYNEKLPL